MSEKLYRLISQHLSNEGIPHSVIEDPSRQFQEYNTYISFHNYNYLDIHSDHIEIVTEHQYSNDREKTRISKSDPELLFKVTNWWHAHIGPQWKAASTKQ